MSLNLGYWPQGAIPSAGYCTGYRHGVSASGKIDLSALETASQSRAPGRFSAIGEKLYCADVAFGYDQYARAALEAIRASYHPLPTASTREFAKFFCKENHALLKEQVTQISGGYAPSDEELFEAMMTAFTLDPPRADPTDERRAKFTPEVTQSYVEEINALVLDRLPEEVKQANKLWDWYALNRNGPSELEDHWSVDTRSRLTSDLQSPSFYLPDD